MLIFQHVLRMIVLLRLLDVEPIDTRSSRTLLHYAARLELQYCQICLQYDQEKILEARALTTQLIDLVGLVSAAQPLPYGLATLLVGTEVFREWKHSA